MCCRCLEVCLSCVDERGVLLVFGNAVESAFGACRLQDWRCLCRASIGHLCLCLAVLSNSARDVVGRHRGQALWRDDETHASCVLR